jgi:uncharacterized membrane protein YhaH (DUF805 family)
MESIINNSKQKSAFWGVIHYMLFSAQGRINRMQYFLGTIAITAIMLAGIIGLFTFFYQFNQADPSEKFAAFIMFAVPFYVFTVFCHIMMAIKRAHDMDLSGHIYWIFLIPLFNILISLVLLFGRGDVSTNRYGQAPINLYTLASI